MTLTILKASQKDLTADLAEKYLHRWKLSGAESVSGISGGTQKSGR